MGKFLEALGLRALTNREALLEELAGMDGGTLDALLFGPSSDLKEQLDACRCEDCMEAHGGSCPVADGERCALSAEAWMAAPCRHEVLILL